MRLAHFLPLIPAQAKYLNLGSFLSKPQAADFRFLEPLVHCAQPTAAKYAFFSSLPKLKATLSSLVAPTSLTANAAAAAVDVIATAMDAAAQAGAGG